MIQVRDDNPVDPITIEVLRAAKYAAEEIGAPLTLVGATARDTILTNVHGIQPTRATADIDIALAIPGWEAFEAMLRKLLEDPRFERAAETPNRLRFRITPGRPGIPVDIVPYGPGVDGDLFLWPRDRDIEMNVAGYADAAANAEVVRISENLVVEVASLAGLALLKVFAWVDRRLHTKKDADDLSTLLVNYIETGYIERIYDESPEVLEAVDFDLSRASCALLGLHVAIACSDETLRQIHTILDDARLMDALAIDISRGMARDPEALQKATSRVEDFRTGFMLRAGQRA